MNVSADRTSKRIKLLCTCHVFTTGQSSWQRTEAARWIESFLLYLVQTLADWACSLALSTGFCTPGRRLCHIWPATALRCDQYWPWWKEKPGCASSNRLQHTAICIEATFLLELSSLPDSQSFLIQGQALLGLSAILICFSPYPAVKRRDPKRPQPSKRVYAQFGKRIWQRDGGTLEQGNIYRNSMKLYIIIYS